MPHLITFQTKKFDPAAEQENPHNPIAGEAVLQWLREQIAPAFALSDPEPEDFGWISSAEINDDVYMVIASADTDQDQPIEWAIQIDKRRSLMDKLRGRNQHEPDDPLTTAIRTAIESEQVFQDVTVDTSMV